MNKAIESTLDRLDRRCWILAGVDSGLPWENGDGIPHFTSERDALRTLNELFEPFAYEAVQQSHCCLSVPDCVRCGGTFDDWMDGMSHVTPGKAQQEIERNDWLWTPKGWLCGNCSHMGPGYGRDDDAAPTSSAPKASGEAP